MRRRASNQCTPNHCMALRARRYLHNLAHPRCAVDLDDGETEAESAAEEEEGEVRCALQVPADFEVDDID